MSKIYKLSYVVPSPAGDLVATGWRLACGAVVHRQLLWGGCQDDAWIVADTTSGASITTGTSMGEAVLRYRQLRLLLGDNWPQALARARKSVHDRVLAMRRRQEFEPGIELPSTVAAWASLLGHQATSGAVQ